MSERTFRRYTIDSPAAKMEVESRIEHLKEWAIVKDVGIVFPTICWEVWVAGELKDTVLRERDAEDELYKYMNESHPLKSNSIVNTSHPSIQPAGDSLFSASQSRRNALTSSVTQNTQQENRKIGIIAGMVVLIVILAVVIVTIKNTGQHSSQLSLNNSSKTPPNASTTFVVQANQGWQNSGISVNKGDQVTIRYISGLWTSTVGTIAPFDGAGRPDGYTCANYLPASQCVEPVPSAAQGALVGRVGSDLLKVGDYLQFTATQGGILYLRMNDGDNGLYDNQGSITVQIVVS